jgi:hypothetical protein
MNEKLKLFVWEDVLTDYTSGVMFALAPDVETARKLLLEKCSYLPKEDLMKEPSVYTKPFALDVWGGG